MTALLGGIDIAEHDAMGKLLNVPVTDLIGGRLRDRVPVYASGGYFTAADDQKPQEGPRLPKMETPVAA